MSLRRQLWFIFCLLLAVDGGNHQLDGSHWFDRNHHVGGYQLAEATSSHLRLSGRDYVSAAGSGYGGGGGKGKGDKGMSFGSLFDLALTALAFLSFGVFLMNLLLDAFFSTGMMTGTATGTGTATVTGTSPSPTAEPTGTARALKGRNRRHAAFLLPASAATEVMALNLARGVEAFLKMRDDRACWQRHVCGSMRQANVVGGAFGFLVPAWSLGGSWLASKLSGSQRWPLEDIRAALLGYRDRDCHRLLPACTAKGPD